MEQHPVPQNISSYEFRLVGDMTLKQFLMLAAGVVVGLVIFQLPLPGLIKYPFVGLSVLTGFLMAFVPVQGRPFAQWITAFINACYAPTEFYWSPPLPSPKLGEGAASIAAGEVSQIPASTVQLPPSKPLAPLSTLEVSAFGTKPTIVNPEPVAKTTAFVPAVPPPPLPAVAPAKAGPPPPIIQSQTPTSTVQLPSSTPPLSNPFMTTLTPMVGHAAPSEKGDKPSNTTTIPQPSAPNLLAGMVTTNDDHPVENSIIEIIDSNSGLPVRALKTNRLGQFQIATPLPSGNYTLYTEKDGLAFAPISIVAEGKLIPPIIIQAKPRS